jgi:hypothetical protein
LQCEDDCDRKFIYAIICKPLSLPLQQRSQHSENASPVCDGTTKEQATQTETEAENTPVERSVKQEVEENNNRNLWSELEEFGVSDLDDLGPFEVTA